MVVCDPAEGNEAAGKLSKVEEMKKPSKEKKKKKPNVKYTDSMTSSKVQQQFHPMKDQMIRRLRSCRVVKFSTLTSYDGQKQY